jgi:hypothetical protein
LLTSLYGVSTSSNLAMFCNNVPMGDLQPAKYFKDLSIDKMLCQEMTTSYGTYS